ncbi:hypothetical protein HanRHA438_Chr16g0768451 [Helianthus annuus]|nr:hypothetical protein HanRHA438_Chr16g0768451 [Helianthus annuus]
MRLDHCLEKSAIDVPRLEIAPRRTRRSLLTTMEKIYTLEVISTTSTIASPPPPHHRTITSTNTFAPTPQHLHHRQNYWFIWFMDSVSIKAFVRSDG